MRIYLPEKVCYSPRRWVEVNITFKCKLILMSTEIEVNNCYIITLSNRMKNILSLLLLKSCSTLNLRTFSQWNVKFNHKTFF